MRPLLACLVAAAVAWSTVGHASDRVHARLTYEPDADVERCPTERELRDAIAARMGYDPFDPAPSADTAALIQIHKNGTGIVGSLELRGPRPGQRNLSSPRGDCREVIDSFAVAIAIGLDPASFTRPPAELPPVAPLPPSSPPVTTSPAERPSPEVKGEPLDVALGAGPVAVFGELPGPTGALAVSVGLRWRWLEPMLEGVATLPVSQSASGGRVTASLLAVAVVPCGRMHLFFACVGLTFGTLRGEGEGVAGPLQGSELYTAASARAGAELAITRSVWVRAYAEAVTPLTRITLQLASQDVWRMPSVAARVGAAAGVRF